MKGVVNCHRVRKDASGLICALQTTGEIEEEALAHHSSDHNAVACARDQVLALSNPVVGRWACGVEIHSAVGSKRAAHPSRAGTGQTTGPVWLRRMLGSTWVQG